MLYRRPVTIRTSNARFALDHRYCYYCITIMNGKNWKNNFAAITSTATRKRLFCSLLYYWLPLPSHLRLVLLLLSDDVIKRGLSLLGKTTSISRSADSGRSATLSGGARISVSPMVRLHGRHIVSDALVRRTIV